MSEPLLDSNTDTSSGGPGAGTGGTGRRARTARKASAGKPNGATAKADAASAGSGKPAKPAKKKSSKPKAPTIEWTGERHAALTAIIANPSVRTARQATELALAHPAFEGVRDRLNLNKVRMQSDKIRKGLKTKTGVELPPFNESGRYEPDWDALAQIVAQRRGEAGGEVVSVAEGEAQSDNGGTLDPSGL